MHPVSNLLTLHNGLAGLAKGCGLSAYLSDGVHLLSPPLPTALARPPPGTPLLLLHLEQPSPASDSIVSGERIIQLPDAAVGAEVKNGLVRALPFLPFLFLAED